jgi:hypothetical protein
MVVAREVKEDKAAGGDCYFLGLAMLFLLFGLQVKKSARSYLHFLLMSYVLAERVEYTEDTFTSASSEICMPGGLYFGYSVFPGVMLTSLMHSPESLFPDLQQLLLALVLKYYLTMMNRGWACMSDLPGCSQ